MSKIPNYPFNNWLGRGTRGEATLCVTLFDFCVLSLSLSLSLSLPLVVLITVLSSSGLISVFTKGTFIPIWLIWAGEERTLVSVCSPLLCL